MAICPSFRENPQKSSLKSLKTVSESQPLGRAGKDKPICPEFPIEMSQDDLFCVSERTFRSLYSQVSKKQVLGISERNDIINILQKFFSRMKQVIWGTEKENTLQ